MPRNVEQKLSVMAEIGIAAELSHISGSVITGRDFCHKKDKFLALADGILQKAESTVKHQTSFSSKALSSFGILSKARSQDIHLLFAFRNLIHSFELLFQPVDLRLGKRFLFPVFLSGVGSTLKRYTAEGHDVAQAFCRQLWQT